MPRSNWKGMITFGLVSIPIVLYPSRDKKADVSFHQIDKKNNARIKYQRVNSVTGKEVPWPDIIRGYEYDKETTIPVPDEVLKKVAGENARTIDIENFIDKDEFDFITIDNTYYLAPDKKGDKGYVILRESLKKSNKIGISKVIISTKEYVAAVMAHENALILCTLSYDSEMRSPQELSLPTEDLAKYKVNKKEIEIATQLIDSMTAKWKPEEYVDDYQAAIHKWIEETVKKKPHTAMKQRTQAKNTNEVNFVDLLKQSISHTKSKKSSDKKSSKVVAAKSKSKGRGDHHHATKH